MPRGVYGLDFFNHVYRKSYRATEKILQTKCNIMYGVGILLNRCFELIFQNRFFIYIAVVLIYVIFSVIVH